MQKKRPAEGDEQEHRVKAIHNHPKRNDAQQIYDFAILELTKAIKFDKARQPIALPKATDAAQWVTFEWDGRFALLVLTVPNAHTDIRVNAWKTQASDLSGALKSI